MIVSEPDIQWWLANRGYDYTDMNVTDHAAMINELQRLGNIRHPHSSSIIDADVLLPWLLK